MKIAFLTILSLLTAIAAHAATVSAVLRSECDRIAPITRLRALLVIMVARPLPAAGIFFLCAACAFGHAPYDRPAGTFVRRDGAELFIVQHYIDGIFSADPVSIQFRLADGTEVARTDYVSHVALQRSPAYIDIYEFETTFFPIAERVQRFDGHVLSDITSPATIRLSPLVHIAYRWLGYLFAPVLAVAWYALRRMPLRGWSATVRDIGLVVVALAISVYLLFLLYGPISPLISAAFAGISTFLYRLIRNRLRDESIRALRCLILILAALVCVASDVRGERKYGRSLPEWVANMSNADIDWAINGSHLSVGMSPCAPRARTRERNRERRPLIVLFSLNRRPALGRKMPLPIYRSGLSDPRSENTISRFSAFSASDSARA